MTAHRKSDRSQPQSLSAGEEQRSRRRFVAGAAIALLLAGAVAYTLAFRTDTLALRTEPAVPPAEQADGFQSPAAPEPEHRSLPDEFVGSQVCGECHSDIAETYSDSPMANTLAFVADASPVEILEGDSAEFESQGCRYRVDRVGDRMIHTELMADADGKPIYKQSVEVQYAVGSGTNARTYLIDRGGIMFESPITWYTDQQKWDLSPGYQDNPRQRFNRRVSDGCVQCHSGRVAAVGDGTSNRFEEPPFPELGIGCERCHGPGKRHVEKFEADDGTAEEMLIVNPARLDGHAAESVCYQCHMEGKRRILRKGKSYHDFRPGMATEDIWTVFVSPTPMGARGTARFTSQAEQMRTSACFRGTEGRMRCTTCHDPHQSPKPDERAAFYRDRCNSCHSDHGCALPIEERESPPILNSCIHCHMPTAGSSNIPHVSQSDHRVLRDPSNEPDMVHRSQRGKVWSIFDESDQRLPGWEVQRARALALCEQAIEDLDQRLMLRAVVALEAVLARDANDVIALRSLGFLYSLSGNHAKAKSAFEAALQRDPHDEMSLKNLGLVAFRTGLLDIGLRSYEGYLGINKWDPTMLGPYVIMLAKSGDRQAAVEAGERGLLLDPTQRELRGIVAKVYARLGDQEKNQQHLEVQQEISKRLDPWDQKRRERLQKQMQAR